MSIQGPNPSYSIPHVGAAAPGAAPQGPPEVVNDILQLWTIFERMGFNPADASSAQLLKLAAPEIHDLITYWGKTGPQSTTDKELYKILTTPDPFSPDGKSIADLVTPDGSTGYPSDDNLKALQDLFKDNDSFADTFYRILTQSNNSHYWFHTVNYSYKWAGTQDNFNALFGKNGALKSYPYRGDYSSFTDPSNVMIAKRIAQDIDAIMEAISKNGAGSPYATLLENFYKMPLGDGKSLEQVVAPLNGSSPTAADAQELYKLLVTPGTEKGAFNLNAQLMEYIYGDFQGDLTTHSEH